MLPQAIVRCPHAFSICASNSVVVVFPFVPVMPMIGHVARIASPTRARRSSRCFADEKFCASGEIGSMPGTQDDKIIRGRVLLAPRSRNAPRLRALADFRSSISQSFFLRAVENGDIGAFASKQEGRGFPLSPAPSTATFLSLVFHIYLSLSVASPRNANMADRIQKRTITVFSFQPLSSK